LRLSNFATKMLTTNGSPPTAIRRRPCSISRAPRARRTRGLSAGNRPTVAANAVRVFYMPQADTEQALKEAVNTIHTKAQIPAFSCFVPRAVAIRGTAAQAVQAESLLAPD